MSGDGPTAGSLFSGIGGLDLGLERAGFQLRWQVERDEWCRAILARHWPGVRRHRDARALVGPELEPVDLIAGGFPCQPVSIAGRRRGVDDERWLWPEFARVIRLLRPRYALVENVPGLLTAGGGFGSILGDLAESGYDAEWQCIPASAVGAPHLRWRVFLLAYPERAAIRGDAGGLAGEAGAGAGEGSQRDRFWLDDGAGCPALAHAERKRLPARDGPIPSEPGRAYRRDMAMVEPGRQGRLHTGEGPAGVGVTGPGSRDNPSPGDTGFRVFAGGEIRVSQWWAIEPDVGRVAHGIPRRVDRLRGLGNAVVPQVAEAIGRMILAADPELGR
jgi:DNA (cytosine-5)-methyltransferase 1